MANEDRRQFIVMMVDTQRADSVGAYGSRVARTPNIDSLASRGIRFDNASCCQAVCSPARSALFTGSYPHTNGMIANEMYLYEHIRTVGQRLQDHGVHSAYIGKWHLDGGDYFGTGECPDGWDPEYWYDMRMYLEELPEARRWASRRFSTVHEEWFSREFTYAHRCAERAKRFIKNHANEDYLLVVSFDEPHSPALCPPEFYEPFKDHVPAVHPNMDDDLTDKPFSQRLWAEDPNVGLGTGASPSEIVGRVAESTRRNLAAASFVDALIGEITEVISVSAPKATVLYTADHGDLNGNHRLRGKGSAMYEENIRVPLIAAGGAVASTPAVYHRPVSQISITPTILDFFSVPGTQYIEGESLLPVFRSPETLIGEHVFVEFSRFQITRDTFGGFQPTRCVRNKRHKLVINMMDRDELYDLEADPGELGNLIDSPEHAAARDALHDVLLNWMDETLDPFRGYQVSSRPWRHNRKPDWKQSGLARQRWDEVYGTPSLRYDSAMPMTTDNRTYSQYQRK